MQPPPNVQYNPFNQPKAPTGRFDWSAMGDSFEIIKAYPWLFVAFTFICGISTYLLSMITNIPLQFAMMGGVSENNLAPLFIAFGIATLLGGVVQIFVYALMFGGAMQMGVNFIRTRFVEFSDGFSVFSKILRLAGGILIPYLMTLPIGLLSLVALMPQLLAFFTNRNPSPEMVGTFITSSIGVIIFSSLATLVVYTFASFTLPAMIVHEIGPFEAFRRSFHAVKSNFGSMVLMNIVFGLILFVSALCCYLPLLFTVPWFANALLLQYVNIAQVDLTGQHSGDAYSPYPREQRFGEEMPLAPPSDSGSMPPYEPETPRDPGSNPPPPPPQQ